MIFALPSAPSKLPAIRCAALAPPAAISVIKAFFARSCGSPQSVRQQLYSRVFFFSRVFLIFCKFLLSKTVFLPVFEELGYLLRSENILFITKSAAGLDRFVLGNKLLKVCSGQCGKTCAHPFPAACAFECNFRCI